MRSLYGKFLLFTVITMLVSAFFAFFTVNIFYHQHLKTQNDTKNMAILKNITHYIETEPPLDLEAFLTTEANVGYKLFLTDVDGASMMFGEAFRLENLPDVAIADVLTGTDYHGMRDLPKETFVTGFFSDEMANTVGTSFHYQGKKYALFLRPNIKMLFTEVHYLLGGMSVVMVILSVIAMLFVARKLIEPLLALTKATKKIGAGEFSVPLPVERHDEIGQLARSFEQMTAELAAADTMKKQFINDVSHDFQTPLQHIKGYTALMKEGVSQKKQSEYLEIIEAETERLSRLTRQLLVLTSLDATAEGVSFSTFRVDQQLKDVLQRYRWLLQEKELTLTSELSATTLYGNEAYIEQVWENLLSNAIKYTPFGGKLDVTLTENAHEVIVQFTDSGIGIAEEHLPLLFNRFYRVDDARNTDIEGTGLGLAIVKNIMEVHKGKVTMESELGHGTTVSVRFPKKA